MKRLILTFSAVLLTSSAYAQVPPAPSTKAYQPNSITEEQKKLDEAVSKKEKKADSAEQETAEEPVFDENEPAPKKAEKPEPKPKAEKKADATAPAGDGVFRDTLGDGELGGNKSAAEDAEFEDQTTTGSVNDEEEAAVEEEPAKEIVLKMGEWDVFVYPGYNRVAEMLDLRTEDFLGGATIPVSSKMNYGQALKSAKVKGIVERSTDPANNYLAVYEGWLVVPKKGRYAFQTSFTSTSGRGQGNTTCGSKVQLAQIPKNEDDDFNFKDLVVQSNARLLLERSPGTLTSTPVVGGSTLPKGRYKIRYITACDIASQFSGKKFEEQTFNLEIRGPGSKDWSPLSKKYIGLVEDE